MTRFFYGCAHEQFDPSTLLDHAVAAEDAGFDGIGCGDHLSPGADPLAAIETYRRDALPAVGGQGVPGV